MNVNIIPNDYVVTLFVVGVHDHMAQTLRGNRLYTPGLLGTIAKVGTCPSAGGSRAAIASVISHMGGVSCA